MPTVVMRSGQLRKCIHVSILIIMNWGWWLHIVRLPSAWTNGCIDSQLWHSVVLLQQNILLNCITIINKWLTQQ